MIKLRRPNLIHFVSVPVQRTGNQDFYHLQEQESSAYRFFFLKNNRMIDPTKQLNQQRFR